MHPTGRLGTIIEVKVTIRAMKNLSKPNYKHEGKPKMNQTTFFRIFTAFACLLLIGLATSSQAATIEVGPGGANPFTTNPIGNTYVFQYQIGATAFGGDGTGVEFMDYFTPSGLAISVSSGISPVSMNFANQGYVASSSPTLEYAIYHFQAVTDQKMTNISVTSNLYTSLGGDMITVSWSSDNSSWTSLESVSNGVKSYDTPKSITGFEGPDLYLKYEIVSAGWPSARFFYNDDISAHGFKVQFDSVSTIPEPSSWVMMILGTLALAGFAYRRYKQSHRTSC